MGPTASDRGNGVTTVLLHEWMGAAGYLLAPGYAPVQVGG